MVRSRLKSIQHRPDLIQAFIAETALVLRPQPRVITPTIRSRYVRMQASLDVPSVRRAPYYHALPSSLTAVTPCSPAIDLLRSRIHTFIPAHPSPSTQWATTLCDTRTAA